VTQIWPIAAGKTLRINGTAPDQTAWSFEIEVHELTRTGDAWNLRSRLAQSTDVKELTRAIQQFQIDR
jgi:hypothetical protein